MANMKTNAPKYQALLDMNTTKVPLNVAPGVRASAVETARMRLANVTTTRAIVSVTFATSAAGTVRVRLFDSMGRVATVLADAKFAAGTHTVSANAAASRRAALPSGYYIVRVETVSDGRVVSQQAPVTIY